MWKELRVFVPRVESARCGVVFQDSGISVQSAIRASWRGASVSCLCMLPEEQK
jgi:hypothetical protein